MEYADDIIARIQAALIDYHAATHTNGRKRTWSAIARELHETALDTLGIDEDLDDDDERLSDPYKPLAEALRRFAGRFNDWSRRSEFIEAHSTFTLLEDGRRLIPERWYWRKGRLTNNLQGDQELPYLHFLVWKKERWASQSPEDLLGPPGLPRREAWVVSAEGWRPMPAEGGAP